MGKDLESSVKLIRSDQWKTSSGKRSLSYSQKDFKTEEEVFANIGLSAYFASVNRAINFKKDSITPDKRNELKHDNADYLNERIRKIYLKNISDFKTFDDWMKESIEHIVNAYQKEGVSDYTIGNAQKLINMSIKYLLSSPLIDEHNGLFKYCHTPIDGIIQKKLHHLGINPLNCPWSKLNSYEEYMRYQNDVRAKIEALGYYSPLICEIDIWQ